MGINIELYVRRRIHRRWKREVADSGDRILAFSPYLTSKTAVDVLLAAASPSRCEVYTLFDPEVFVTGASSVRTLKRLAKAGVQLYSLNNLHAKVVVVPGQFASIGSQNITAGGTRRLEASIATTDPAVVGAIWRRVEPWIKDRVPISTEMIEDMERLVRPLVPKMKELRSEMEAVAVEIKSREEERRRKEQLARQQQRESIAALNEARNRTTAVWRNAVPKSQRTIRARVVWNSGRWRKYSLKRKSKGDLTSWRLDSGEVVRFPRLKFSVCMIYGTWRLAFVRVAKHVVSFVHDSVRWTSPVEIGGQQCVMTFRTSWNGIDSEQPANLHCEVETKCGTMAFQCWFHLNGIKVYEPTATPKYGHSEVDMWLWYVNVAGSIRSHIVNKLLTPFTYSDGVFKLSSVNSFFGNPGTRYRLHAAKVMGRPVLVAERW